jgi:hypothetical protein
MGILLSSSSFEKLQEANKSEITSKLMNKPDTEKNLLFFISNRFY